MTVRLVYLNASDQAMAWKADVEARAERVRLARVDWLDRFARENGLGGRGDLRFWVREHRVSGVDWPANKPTPRGWRRPAGRPEVLEPHRSYAAGKRAVAELAELAGPDLRRELTERLGMRTTVVPRRSMRLYDAGARLEHDGVWVTWGSLDVQAELDGIGDHGWDRVPLARYLERFGEGEL